MLKRLLFISLLLSPAAAWALYKPMRVLAPQLVSGITCVTEIICTDDTTRYGEAERLGVSGIVITPQSRETGRKRPFSHCERWAP